jgi:bifunctional DNase/RNase
MPSPGSGVPHTVKVIEVTVAGLGIAPPSSVPLLLLKERTGERVLPVGIGPLEAQAIVMPLQGVKPPRPLTHDIMLEIVTSLGVHLRRVEIVELIESTFHARLTVEYAGQERVYDIRPSDGVALAVRTETPIFVAEAVFDQAGIASPQVEEMQEPHAPEATSPESKVDESKLTPFKEFIESLDIDDLGSDKPS